MNLKDYERLMLSRISLSILNAVSEEEDAANSEWVGKKVRFKDRLENHKFGGDEFVWLEGKVIGTQIRTSAGCINKHSFALYFIIEIETPDGVVTTTKAAELIEVGAEVKRN
jgi:hypothetical protein